VSTSVPSVVDAIVPTSVPSVVDAIVPTSVPSVVISHCVNLGAKCCESLGCDPLFPGVLGFMPWVSGSFF